MPKMTPEQQARRIVEQNMQLNEYGEQVGSLNCNDVWSLTQMIADAIEKAKS